MNQSEVDRVQVVQLLAGNTFSRLRGFWVMRTGQTLAEIEPMFGPFVDHEGAERIAGLTRTVVSVLDTWEQVFAVAESLASLAVAVKWAELQGGEYAHRIGQGKSASEPAGFSCFDCMGFVPGRKVALGDGEPGYRCSICGIAQPNGAGAGVWI